MPLSMSSYAKTLEQSLERQAKPELARKMKAYMKDNFPFLGVPAPERKELLKRHILQHGKPEPQEELEVLHYLWDAEARELQYCAMELWKARPKKSRKPSDLEQINYMIANKPWWDTVDFIASNLAGTLLKEFPDLKEKAVEQWSAHESIWMNRTAILFQLKYKKDTDEDLLFALCDQFISSTEFFHRKAIGWALRELSKHKPQAVIDYVKSRKEHLSGLSYREALKHLKKNGYEDF